MSKNRLQQAKEYVRLCSRIEWLEVILLMLAGYGFGGVLIWIVGALISASGVDAGSLALPAVAAALTIVIYRYLRNLKRAKATMEQEIQDG